MKYAVIKLSGSQHLVQENDILTINHLDPDQKVAETLLISDNGKIQLGQPLVEKASVEFEIVKNYPGKKIRIYKYKAKSRYHKTQGFRPELTDIKITKINGTH